MTPPREKGNPQKRKPASQQPSLISNYFKKVDSSAEKESRRPVSANPPPAPARNGDLPASQISPGRSEDEDDGHVRKRPRLHTPPSSDSSRAITPVERNASEQNALSALMSPKVKEFRPPPQSPRTARYKYIPNSPDKPAENATPQELARKQSLHEKFVQKLGRPESLVRARRPSQEGSPAEEDEGVGGEEDEEMEEVPAAAKGLRGKYARGGAKAPAPKRASKSTTAVNAKLTPLERQYVEIKKSYPDTLLLIEVGYKFRFFGEDAKVLLSQRYSDGRLPRKNSELRIS